MSTPTRLAVSVVLSDAGEAARRRDGADGPGSDGRFGPDRCQSWWSTLVPGGEAARHERPAAVGR